MSNIDIDDLIMDDGDVVVKKLDVVSNDNDKKSGLDEKPQGNATDGEHPSDGESDAEDEVAGGDDEFENEDGTVFTFNEPIRGEHEIVVIKPENRITSELMTKEEMTEAISIRIRQLEEEYITFLPDGHGLTTPADIAKREMNLRLSPLILRRRISTLIDPETRKTTEYYEYWPVREMEKRFVYNV